MMFTNPKINIAAVLKALPCPDYYDVAFGRKLIKALGGNPRPIRRDWCWSEFGYRYPELRRLAESYFLHARTGNPSYAAVSMYLRCGSAREWAKAVIERDRTGNPAWWARYLRITSNNDQRWAEGVVLRAAQSGLGDPLTVASDMCQRGSSERWAAKVGAAWNRAMESASNRQQEATTST